MSKTQMNFGHKPGYKTAASGATISHAQSNFDGGRTTAMGGKNKSGQQKNFPHGDGSGRMKRAVSHFGEKSGTGNNNGY